jgi:hypothetical protein
MEKMKSAREHEKQCIPIPELLGISTTVLETRNFQRVEFLRGLLTVVRVATKRSKIPIKNHD